ncbi:MAG: hypothetical protein WC455_17995 [Dehalococcoidia bacterium]|jgi:hypothetical protein
MTRAEIITTIRGLTNENSTDSGALLSDSGNLLEFINDAQEQVVADVMPFMRDHLMGSETVTLIAGTANYALTGPLWQVYKVEIATTGDAPREIDIIDQYEKPFHAYTGDTTAEPLACYFIGDTIYFVPTPSAAATTYARVWFVKPEAVSMAVGGPTLLPPVAHRLIAYQAASLIAVMMGKDPSPYQLLYAQKLQAVQRVWAGRYQQRPRFVKDSIIDRGAIDSRLRVDNDKDW